MTDRQRLVLFAVTLALVPFVILFEDASVFGIVSVGLGVNLLALVALRPDAAQSSAAMRFVAKRLSVVLALGVILVAIGVFLLIG